MQPFYVDTDHCHQCFCGRNGVKPDYDHPDGGGAPGHLCWLAARSELNSSQLLTIHDVVGIDGSGDNQPRGIQGNTERPLVVKKYHPDGGHL